MKRIEFEDALVVEPAKVSILDEMPVGSVIDYDGDEVPAGWEEAGSADYSTEETFTGKYWIDGKKIYRKVIEKNISKANNTYSYSSLGLTNIGTIIKLYGISAGNPIEQDYYAGSEDSLRTFANVNGINVNSGSSYPTMPYTLYIIIEYTKTTD